MYPALSESCMNRKNGFTVGEATNILKLGCSRLLGIRRIHITITVLAYPMVQPLDIPLHLFQTSTTHV